MSDAALRGRVPTGAVNFADGSVPLGTGVIDATGHATLTASLALGMHTITATYGGDSTFLGASGTTMEEVDPAGSVSGHAWADTNRNGVDDPFELGLAGVGITLNDPNGNAVSSTPTDASGNYHFTGLGLGTYTLNVVPPAGQVPTGYHQGTNPHPRK